MFKCVCIALCTIIVAHGWLEFNGAFNTNEPKVRFRALHDFGSREFSCRHRCAIQYDAAVMASGQKWCCRLHQHPSSGTMACCQHGNTQT